MATPITTRLTAPVKFAREARDELKKVSWPSRETAVRYTIIVIVSSLVIGTLIGGIDYLLTLGLEELILK